MKLSLNANAIRAAMIACPKKADIRYYLNGVLLEFTHGEPSESNIAMVAGTDGHMLFAGQCRIDWLENPQKGGFSLIIPLETLKKCNKKFGTWVLESTDDGGYLIDSIKFHPADGKYPDYRRVIPHAASIVNQYVAFNPELLVRANDALKAYYMPSKKDHVYPLSTTANSGVMHDGTNDALVVIMGMRTDIPAYHGLNSDFMPALKAA
jgi:hypothetical protein